MMPAINISPTGFQMLGFLYSHQECEGHQKPSTWSEGASLGWRVVL